MNRPEIKDNLIPVREYAKTFYSRRGFPVTVQYIYKLISANKDNGKQLPFDYVEIDKAIWIKK